MNKIVFLLLIAISTLAFASPAPLTQLWAVKDLIENPESAYYDPASKQIFVSNIAGAPDGKDGKGWISKLDASGKVITAKWVEGLDAPKGMRAHAGKLWVTNITEVVSITIATGKLDMRFRIGEAKFLNDIAIDDKGVIYVSDTAGDRIYQIDGEKVSTFAEGESLEHPNGLLISKGNLIVASWGTGLAPDWSTKVPGHLWSIDLKTKKATKITPKPLGHLDGLESDGKSGWYVSDWSAGKVFHISSKGVATEILGGVKNAADIGLLTAAGASVLLVPAMGGNTITAYKGI